MRLACRMTKPTNTHSEYVMLIVFPLQQWLFTRPSCYAIRTISCLVRFSNDDVTTCNVTTPLRRVVLLHLAAC